MPDENEEKQNFVADLHIHSRFSMATSKQLTVPHLAFWAMRKGINVLGTGDFTHPKWRQELREGLVYDEESGFYRLSRDNLALLEQRPDARPPFFCLQAEISSIYRRDGKVRKIHNLVFAPNLEVADEISRRLALIGNINSDGRPILGLDSRDLLELVLECSPDCVLIPAHIWTPWFSLFGSRSGFDRLEECYGDLSGHIFALETGLSSDPPMNRCWSALDSYALISNSDAHSGANLGREANLFAGTPSYRGMFAALRSAAMRAAAETEACKFLGTLEFYPEEGKYHLDGHRACNVSLDPAESSKLNNICPVCGKPLTIGVLHRVMELADRTEPASLVNEPTPRMLVPLQEVIAQILGAGANSRKVLQKYEAALAALGPELDILCRLPAEQIEKWWEPLAEGVRRIRAGNVRLVPGFDGQFGQILVFAEDELSSLHASTVRGAALPGFAAATAPQKISERKLQSLASDRVQVNTEKDEFSQAQRKALRAGPGPVFVMAGPGSGKTRVLTGRLAWLLRQGIAPERLLAITFTRRAAEEMRRRIRRIVADGNPPLCDTLHALAWHLFRENFKQDSNEGIIDCQLPGEETCKKLFLAANSHLKENIAVRMWQELGLLRELYKAPQGELLQAFLAYNRLKRSGGQLLLDYGDLLEWLLRNVAQFRGRWQHVLVDEAQDLSPLQLKIVSSLLPASGEGFFGIGDPDQSIYEFRGAGGQSDISLRKIWPNLEIFRLTESYRSSQKILDMASAALGNNNHCGKLRATARQEASLVFFQAKNERQEAGWIARQIKSLLGATAHTLVDQGSTQKSLAPGDIAVLVRLKSMLSPVCAALTAAGIPWEAPADKEFWQDPLCLQFIELARNSEPAAGPEKFLQELAAGGNKEYALLAKSADFGNLCAFWRQCGDWDTFFQQLAWQNEAEIFTKKAEKVHLLTLHSAKGLEFECVFLPGLENGILPLDRRLLFGRKEENDCDPAAERRLCYVGITRAAAGIYASFCRQRRLYGKTLYLEPSPFAAMIRRYCRIEHEETRALQGKLF